MLSSARNITVLLLLAACHRQPEPHPDANASTAATSPQQDATLILEKHCGLCHREDSLEAKKGALAVFNLNKPNWFASMSEEQLRSARGRLTSAPTGGDPADPEDLARFDVFMNGELQRRDGKNEPGQKGSARSL
jgi:hypothetical protein